MENSSSNKSIVSNLIQEERDLNNKINISYPYPLRKNDAKIFPENIESANETSSPSSSVSGVKKAEAVFTSCCDNICSIS